MKPDVKIVSTFYDSSHFITVPLLQALGVCKQVAFPQSKHCNGVTGAWIVQYSNTGSGTLGTRQKVPCLSSTHRQPCFAVFCDVAVIRCCEFSSALLFRLWPCLLKYFLR